jgi:hypothetical protein
MRSRCPRTARWVAARASAPPFFHLRRPQPPWESAAVRAAAAPCSSAFEQRPTKLGHQAAPNPPPSPQLTMRALLPWARDNLLQDRPELFMKGDSV